MNFIAHIHLSGNENDALLVGNYIADLIRPKEVDLLSHEIKEGIWLHRFIDSYTDGHQINKDMLDALYSKHRKYAPVLLDIYYDYYLIRHWDKFSPLPLSYACQRAYHVLAKNIDEIPPTAIPNIENLLNKKWLESAYGSIAGLEKTFHFLKMRMSKPDYIIGASQTLIDLDAELDQAFLSFYPQLVSAVNEFISEQENTK